MLDASPKLKSLERTWLRSIRLRNKIYGLKGWESGI